MWMDSNDDGSIKLPKYTDKLLQINPQVYFLVKLTTQMLINKLKLY